VPRDPQAYARRFVPRGARTGDEQDKARHGEQEKDER
jgi:hypothetical protein